MGLLLARECNVTGLMNQLFITRTLFVFKQYTEEKLGQAEKTELDAHFENLLQRADNTKLWTETILTHTEVVLQPNPSRWTMFVSLLCSVNFTLVSRLF